LPKSLITSFQALKHSRFIKEIRAIENKDIENGIKALKKQVSQSYLTSIREREESVDEGKETLTIPIIGTATLNLSWEV